MSPEELIFDEDQPMRFGIATIPMRPVDSVKIDPGETVILISEGAVEIQLVSDWIKIGDENAVVSA